jgi:hypothetical protein
LAYQNNREVCQKGSYKNWDWWLQKVLGGLAVQRFEGYKAEKITDLVLAQKLDYWHHYYYCIR